MFSILINSY